jgi:hypothetical protein
MERKRVCSSERSGSASAAAIPTMTKLFMATTLSRSNPKADTNSGDSPPARKTYRCQIP